MKDCMRLRNNRHHSGVAPGTHDQAPCWIMDLFQVHLAKTLAIGHEHTQTHTHRLLSSMFLFELKFDVQRDLQDRTNLS